MSDERHNQTAEFEDAHRLSRRDALRGIGGSLAAAAGLVPALGRLVGTAHGATTVGGAEILWDTWGVPHIFAPDDESLFYAYGWAQAHNHGDAILRLYGGVRGRGAEYWGESELAGDRFILTMGVPARARQWYEAQSPSMRRILDAFAAGINDYAAAHPAAIAAAVKVVLPVTGVDPLALIQNGLTLFTFIGARTAVVAGWNPSSTVVPGAAPAGGSNGWVIGPTKSASGHAMLLANPHLNWTQPSQILVEAHLVSPNVDFYGATLIGYATPLLGFNDFGGWTHTINVYNGADLYELTLDGDGYRFDGAVNAFDTITHTIKVRQPDGSLHEEPVAVRSSVHGPVVATRDDGKALAVRVAGLDRPGIYEEYLAMGAARSLGQFEDALRRVQIPMFHTIYANRDGDILLFFNSFTPKRPFGDWDYWWGVIPGETSATLWSEILDYDELPKLINPPSGWLQNANDPPWQATLPRAIDRADYPPYVSDQYMHQRPQRAVKMLLDKPRLTLEDVVADKFSNRVELADRILDDLVAAAQNQGSDLATRAAAVLRGWDRQTNADSRGALLFLYWAAAMDISNLPIQPGVPLSQESAADQARAQVMASGLFATPWRVDEPLATPRGLADPAACVAALETAAAKLEAETGSLDTPYGQVATLTVGAYEVAASGGPNDPVGIFNALPLPFGLTYMELQDNPGDTWIAAVEFGATARARVLLSYGNATQPGSPHHGDQLPLLARGELRPAWRTRAEIEANLESREVVGLAARGTPAPKPR
jgi:acyl-homoserine-lactone acylase